METRTERVARPFWQASRIADEFVRSIADCAERIVVAGSIRRKCAYVGDIDIVAVSKLAQETVAGWFATETVTKSLLHERISQLVNTGFATPRVKKDGKTMVGELVAFLDFKGCPLDLYYASEKTWWGLVQMRTGSSRFNTMLASRALAMGLKYHGDGYGVTKDGVRVDDGSSEEGIFSALELKYLPPEERN